MNEIYSSESSLITDNMNQKKIYKYISILINLSVEMNLFLLRKVTNEITFKDKNRSLSLASHMIKNIRI
jgi:hypothetical protein